MALPGLNAADAPPEALEEIPGVTEWSNRGNRFYVAQVHYTADPEKRIAAWKADAAAGMDRKGWLREYEISFDVPGGDPVFPEYDGERMRRPLRVLPDARLLRFWDFGHVCPVCLFAQQDAWGRLGILRELILPGTALEGLIYAVQALTLELTGDPLVQCFDAGDPAGEKMTDLGQVRKVLGDHGIGLHTRPSGGKHTWGDEGSYAQLRSRLLRNVIVPGTAATALWGAGPSPAFLLDPSCKVTHSALAGSFHKGEKPPFKPVDVHPYKDVCDALRYGESNLAGASSRFMERMAAVARQDVRPLAFRPGLR